MFRWVLFLLAGLGLVAFANAEARMHAGPNMLSAGHRLHSPVDVPLDALTAAAGAYSFRKLRSAYAGPAVRLWRISDSAVLDVGFVGFVPGLGAPFDVAAANAHCPTQCWVEQFYDQSGNAMHVGRFSASGPIYVASCAHGKPCARYTVAGELLATAATPTWATVTSLNVVARRGTGGCGLIRRGTAQVYAGAAGQWIATDATANAVISATDNVWHTGVAVINGASSAARLDATEVATGTLTAATTAERIAFGTGGAGIDCDVSEGVVWNAYALTLNERAVLTQNQRSFWGF